MGYPFFKGKSTCLKLSFSIRFVLKLVALVLVGCPPHLARLYVAHFEVAMYECRWSYDEAAFCWEVLLTQNR